ncbi:RcnB family protein [Phenylobacterium immobile]|uniref:RcnB family protein n=1 Tax=Phenylobacterium immobile TaxID=21 RepID=UPI000A3FC4F1|nr:RcnB family protein [Phenylobacterium immobile]
MKRMPIKRVLLATAGVLLSVAPIAAVPAFAQEGRQRPERQQERGQQGRQQQDRVQQERGPNRAQQNPGQGGWHTDRADTPRAEAQARPEGEARPANQAQPQRPPQAPRQAGDNNGRGYRPGDNRRVWADQPQSNAPRQVQPQRQDPRIDRGPAERRNDPRWSDRGARQVDPRRDDRRYDDRRYDNRQGDRRWDDRGYDNNRRWSQNGYFGYGPRWNAPQRYRLPAYRPPIGFGFRAWSFGQILPQVYYSDSYVLNDFWNYGLPEPPPGTFWVRSGADALLVEQGSGYIIEVAANLFW